MYPLPVHAVLVSFLDRPHLLLLSVRQRCNNDVDEVMARSYALPFSFNVPLFPSKRKLGELRRVCVASAGTGQDHAADDMVDPLLAILRLAREGITEERFEHVQRGDIKRRSLCPTAFTRL